MKKSNVKLLFLMIIAFGLPFSTFAQYILGYSSDNYGQTVGEELSDKVCHLATAMEFEPSDLAPVTGKQITKVQVYLSGEKKSTYPVKNYEDLTVFVRNTIDGTNICSQVLPKAKIKLDSWNEIVLENPYTISGEKIFIGYSIDANSTPIGFDGRTTPNPKATWIYAGEGWKQYNQYGNTCIQAIVEGENLPQYNVSFLQTLSPSLIMPEGEFSLTTYILNKASATITSFDVVCKVGDEEVGKTTVSGVDISFGTAAMIEVPGLTCSKEGDLNLQIIITNLNGTNEDADISDNGLDISLLSTKECAPRKVLLEHFTTLTCPNCPEGLAALTQAIKGREDRVVWVAHHTGFNPDQYTLSESNNFLGFYAGGSYAPAGMFDRMNFADWGALNNNREEAAGPVMDIFSAEFDKFIIERRLSEYAPVNISIEQTCENWGDRTITVKGKRLQPLKGSNPSVSVFLTEDGLPGSSSHGIQNHVLRCIANAKPYYGDAIKFEADGSFTATYKVTLDKDWNPANMHVIAFVSNVDKTSSPNPNNYNVYNAEIVPLLNDATGIEANEAETSVYVYGENGTIYVNGEEDVSMQVFTVDGKSVDNIGLSNGIYIVRITTDKGVVSKKLQL